MTVLDICIDTDGYMLFRVDPYGEAFDSTFELWEFTDILTPAQLRRLGRLLSQLTANLFSAAASPDHADIVSVLDVGMDCDSGVRCGHDPYDEAVETVLRIRDLAKLAGRNELGHLALRLRNVTNDIIFASDRPCRCKQDRKGAAPWRRSR